MENCKDNKENINIEKLNIADNIIDGFSCGKPDIDNIVFESHYANAYRQVYIYVCRIDNIDIGYLGFSITSLSRQELNANYGHNSFTEGIVYMNYIAVTKNEQGKGYGSRLLDYFIDEICEISKKIPIRFIILDPHSDKVEWYKKRKFNFIGKSNRMYYDLLSEDEIQYIDKM